MDFLPNLFQALSYGAIIPVYILLIVTLISIKKKKNAEDNSFRLANSNNRKNGKFLGSSLDGKENFIEAEDFEFEKFNAIDDDADMQINDIQILKKLVRIGVVKEGVNEFDHDLLELSWYQSN